MLFFFKAPPKSNKPAQKESHAQSGDEKGGEERRELGASASASASASKSPLSPFSFSLPSFFFFAYVCSFAQSLHRTRKNGASGERRAKEMRREKVIVIVKKLKKRFSCGSARQ